MTQTCTTSDRQPCSPAHKTGRKGWPAKPPCRPRTERAQLCAADRTSLRSVPCKSLLSTWSSVTGTSFPRLGCVQGTDSTPCDRRLPGHLAREAAAGVSGFKDPSPQACAEGRLVEEGQPLPGKKAGRRGTGDKGKAHSFPGLLWWCSGLSHGLCGRHPLSEHPFQSWLLRF